MRYVKKPVIIEAAAFMGFDSHGQVIFSEYPDWLTREFAKGIIFFDEPNTLTIKTLEGNMEASRGDWVIKGVKGELYPCKPDIFHMTYEQVLE